LGVSGLVQPRGSVQLWFKTGSRPARFERDRGGFRETRPPEDRRSCATRRAMPGRATFRKHWSIPHRAGRRWASGGVAASLAGSRRVYPGKLSSGRL